MACEGDVIEEARAMAGGASMLRTRFCACKKANCTPLLFDIMSQMHPSISGDLSCAEGATKYCLQVQAT